MARIGDQGKCGTIIAIHGSSIWYYSKNVIGSPSHVQRVPLKLISEFLTYMQCVF
jgi:hypothetical protein